jgi:hypothetical protein
MIREAENDWGQWVLARSSIAFALEEEIRSAAADDDLLWSLDPDGALEAMERLGDALDAALREITERQPPVTLKSFGDALLAYLSWRSHLNDQMVQAAETDGWDGARAAFVAHVNDGLAHYQRFEQELQAIEAQRSE